MDKQAAFEQGFNDRVTQHGFDKEANKLKAILAALKGGFKGAPPVGPLNPSVAAAGSVGQTLGGSRDALKLFGKGMTSAHALPQAVAGSSRAYSAGLKMRPGYQAAREAYMPFHDVGAEGLRRVGGAVAARPLRYAAGMGAGGYLLGSQGGGEQEAHYAGDGHNHGGQGASQGISSQQLDQFLQNYNKSVAR